MAKSPKPDTTDPSDVPSQTDQPTFEEALERLQGIVVELEEGRIGLNDALGRYEQGVKLLRHCHDLLEKAERRIELVTGVDAEGTPITAPFDDNATTLEEKASQRSRRRTSSEG
jgi:exodeoxyribonuclease VII small subunit